MTKMITPTLVDSLLEFANTEEIEIDAGDVDAICNRHATGPVWRRLDRMRDKPGHQSLIDLHRKVRGWLDILAHGSVAKKRKLSQEIVDSIQHAASEKAVISWIDLDGKPGGVEIDLIGLPSLAIDAKGNLSIYVKIIRPGIHAVILYGMLEIYGRKLTFRISRCEICGKYYEKKPGLRVACSIKCKDRRRSGKVSKHVEAFRLREREKHRAVSAPEAAQ
jgi:hypothetical protein